MLLKDCDIDMFADDTALHSYSTSIENLSNKIRNAP